MENFSKKILDFPEPRHAVMHALKKTLAGDRLKNSDFGGVANGVSSSTF